MPSSSGRSPRRTKSRDEFPLEAKRAVETRANGHCSFRGCGRPTGGPSAESTNAVNRIGKAAHIHAAAPGPGARRYLASMSHEQRSHIDNAIWLCATHADMIDRDDVAETIERIRWRLWHGQVRRALDLIAETVVTMDVAAAARKVARLLGELETYVVGQILTATRCPARMLGGAKHVKYGHSRVIRLPLFSHILVTTASEQTTMVVAARCGRASCLVRREFLHQ